MGNLFGGGESTDNIFRAVGDTDADRAEKKKVAATASTPAKESSKDSFSRSGRSNRYRRRLQGGGTGSVETEKKSLLGN